MTPYDATAASREIEALLSGAGARIINRQLSDVSETIKLEISAGNLISLVVKLKKLGKVKSKDMPSSISPEEKIIIHLEIAENIR